MMVLPIVGRELRVVARRPGTYWARFLAATVALGSGAVISLVMVDEPPAYTGIGLFIALTVLAFACCLLSGLILTADCLSEEKREGTLGLLFLTDLKGLDVVAGKLTATSLSTLCAVLAVVPVLALTLMFGGVSGAELGRVALALLNTIFFSLTAGLLASAVCRSARRALGLALLVVALLTAVFPVVAFFAIRWRLVNFGGGYVFPGDPRALAYWLLFQPSPGFTVLAAFDHFYKQFGYWYWSSFATVLLLGWLFLRTASFILPRSWQEKVLAPETAGWRAWWRKCWGGSAASRQTRRARLLAINPFLYLTERERWKLWLVWLFLGAAALLWLWGWRRHGRYWTDPTTYVFTGLVLGAILKIWIAGEASRQLSAHRHSGALELLLVTPLDGPQIIRGQWLAVRRQFMWPVLILLVVDLGFALTDRYDREWMLMWLAGMAVLITDVLALSWQAMWLGLLHSRPNRAMLATVARLLVLPWLIYGLVLLGLMTLPWLLRKSHPQWSNWEPSFSLCLLLWFTIAMGASVLAFTWSRWRLLTRFREVAAQPIGRPYSGSKETCSLRATARSGSSIEASTAASRMANSK